VSNANLDYCDAIRYAREAIRLKSDFGKAYIQLGDAFIASREQLGDDFRQRTSFWAAVDMYLKAASVDSSQKEEATQKVNDYRGQFPDQEEIFFHDLKEGEAYLVEGCINTSTTVRARQPN
jgi:hypothetical protein